jgi:hypothetical protein
MSISDSQIDTAYRKLKRYVYYDKTDLVLRKSLAEFECSTDFRDRLTAVQTVLNSAEPSREKAFQRWLTKIDFRIVPKGFGGTERNRDAESTSSGRFITNVTSGPNVQVDKVNYFFVGPIELHLVAVLWIMLEGHFLDAQLGPECRGSRLHPGIHTKSDSSAGLFRKYHEQYAQWRDSGIRKAKQMLVEDRQSVAILGLDVQEYYYRIRLDTKAIARAISRAQDQDNVVADSQSFALSECLGAIHDAYSRAISPLLRITHADLPERATGLPIGLCSSLVLANWYLKQFDDSVKESVRPAYYGRYVDDILMVIPAAKNPEKDAQDPIAAFMEELLVKTGVLRDQEAHRYELTRPRGLYLQQGKCILQYFDARHSIAGLEKFQKKLEENGSDFLLLPVDEADSSIEDVAYELQYEGSVNKFRSVKGMSGNRFELAKHLARQTILHLITDDPPDAKVSLGLRQFFKGKSAIEFFDLWERVFTFFQISDDPTSAKAFARHLCSEINRIRCSSGEEIGKRLIDGLQRHLTLSRAMAKALSARFEDTGDHIAGEPVAAFRNANLIRHHFVRKPMLNYTTFEGPFTTRQVRRKVDIDARKLELSPRYINFDECLLLTMSGEVSLERRSAYRRAREIYQIANRQEVSGLSWTRAPVDEDISNA